MEYSEEKMIPCFLKRYGNNHDIVNEKRITMMFIKLHGLSIFKFINRLREYDEKICEEFVEALENDKKVGGLDEK